MKELYCFWTIAHGNAARWASSLLRSARQAGVFKEFHVWTDGSIVGGVRHEFAPPAKAAPLLALELLQTEVAKLNYKYYVWLSPDTWFVRNPGNVLRVLQGAPVHASLESDLACPENVRAEWEECSRTNHLTLMRFSGIRSRSVFTAAGGFWIVHREVIETFCDLAWNYWELCERAGHVFNLEPVLAYAVQMLCGNPHVHTLRHTADLWAVDRMGCFADRLPDGEDWTWVDNGTREKVKLNPALVHGPHSHSAF